VFSLLNGKLTQYERPSIISLYEFGSGVLLLTLYLIFLGGFGSGFFDLSGTDWLYIFILASFYTTYAFIASVKILKYNTPYTVMLTNDLEPGHGIGLAFFVIADSERMNHLFIVMAAIILDTEVTIGILMNGGKLKRSTMGL